MRSVVCMVLLGMMSVAGQLSYGQSVAPGLHLAAQVRAGGGSYLGVALAEVDAERAKSLKLGDERGVEIMRVEEGSPAEKASIKAGDVLLTYNGEALLGAEQLGRLVRETPPGRKVRVELWRNGKTESVLVTTAVRRAGPVDAPSAWFRIPDMNSISVPDMPEPALTWKSAFLGIECEAVDSQLAEYFGAKQGVLVRYVAHGSAAEKGGLKAGDVVTKVGERAVTTPREISASLRLQNQPGKPIGITLMRDRKEVTFKVVPDEPRPVFPKAEGPSN